MFYKTVKFVLFFPLFADIAVGDEDSFEDFDDKSPKDERVLEGKPLEPPYSRPYIAQLRYLHKDYEIAVGGTISDKYTIITSNWNKGAYRVFAGKYYFQQTESSQQERKICWVSLASEKPDAIIDSYALLHLDKPLSFNKFVQPANLTKYGDKEADSNCRLTSWGRYVADYDFDPINSEVLLEAEVSIRRWKACDSSANPVKPPSLLCMSRHVAQLDHGSPITCSDKSGRDVVSGYALHEEEGNKVYTVMVASLAGLSPSWIDKQLAIGAWKCGRETGCCHNDDKINGFPVIPHSRPFIVQIHYKSSKEVSTGVLINAYTILTSAHKLKDIIKVTAGKSVFGKYEGTQQTRRPCDISKHPSFDKPENAYGYGLIHLSDPFVLNEFVNGISIAPKGDISNDECSIIGWQGNSTKTVLREQLVKFKDPKTCPSAHQTVTCVEGGACLHDWGSPVVCSHNAKIYLKAIVSSQSAYCKDAVLASISDMPRDWLATELRKAETTCGKSTL